MNFNFNYNLPVNLIFGQGKIEELGKLTAKYGKKAIIVTGRNSTKKSGLLDKSVKLLASAGVESVVFDKVDQNPTDLTMYEAVEVIKENGCDIVVALGGGSIIDCAKAAAYMALNDGDVFDYIYGVKTGETALPLIAVPTTCGTGTEGNGFAVLTNTKNNDKKSLRSNLIVAKASIIDPDLMKTMPKHILAQVSFDALCHNMEAFLSANAQPLTDMMAKQAIELIGKYLPMVYNDYSCDEGWNAITWASTLGGMVINTAGVATAHALEHPASGLRNIVHGRGLAALTPVIYDEAIKAGAPTERFAEISRLLGGKDETDCVETIKKLIDSVGLTTTLSAEGVKEEDIDWMADNTYKIMGGAIQAFPVVFSVEDIKNIYKKAL
ncbi:MAG: iron-containing alcohol dehydrogenase [Candidatus Metalachnospira sp.]|nr:iron-containing alcohol dehydrogenase [Candidatus Metalachnospira sp.]